MSYEVTLVGFDGLTPRVVFGRIKEVKGRYDTKRAEKKLARAASNHGRRDGELKALKEQTVKAVGMGKYIASRFIRPGYERRFPEAEQFFLQ
jgi:hypothetical protein